MQKTYTNFVPKEYEQPKFFRDCTYSYLTQMGSRVYNANEETSDYDFYGFIVPPAEIVFPHLAGNILGFGNRFTPFEQYQMQHVQHPVFGEIDLTIYNIVKYFQLVMNGNPNMVDSLFTEYEDVLHCDKVGEMVKEYRHLFLSEKMYHTFKGMAWSHASRLKSGKAKEGRKDNQEQYGWDTKDGYHTIRILLQIRDVLSTGDLKLKKYGEYLRNIRNGQFTLEYVLNKFEELTREIEEIVAEGSAVPYSPDEKKIKELLVACLEMSYGSLHSFGFGVKE